tara:strand:- start:9782 stop:10720 length:939 start_codon:yes stop_codon:yes gene_type:complete
MNSSIEKKIYLARSIGNVEPIEYMVPYPNTIALLEGQNIKYSKQLLYEKPEITNIDFFNLVQQTANWLESINIHPKEEVVLPDLGSPQSEILLYGIWHLGAVAILSKSKKIDKKIFTRLHIIEPDIDLFDIIHPFPKKFIPRYKALLDDEALINYTNNSNIRLSHYNLLVNTNGLKKLLKINRGVRIACDLEPLDSSWTVFKVLLPLYCGAIYSDSNPDITISSKDTTAAYFLRKDIDKYGNLKNNHIGICLENTAVLCLGNEPIHLTEIEKEKGFLKLNGHSVMMGYTDNLINERAFKKKGLWVKLNNINH